MRIGIDMDGTIKHTHRTAIETYNRLFQRTVSLDDLTEFRLDLAYGIEEKEALDLWKKWETNIYETTLPFDHASDVIRSLVREGHDIHFVTARPASPEVRRVTEAWLAKHDFPHTGKNLYMGAQKKGDVAQQLGLDCFFEDDPFHLNNLLEYKIPTVIFDAPYNRLFAVKLPRLHCWSKAKDTLTALQTAKEST